MYRLLNNKHREVPVFYKRLMAAPKHLAAWLVLDLVYVSATTVFLGHGIHLTFGQFALAHVFGVFVGTMVMFTGLGAGVLWVPLLTFIHIRPVEAVSISIFTQIAGKGVGSLTYLLNGMVDLKVAFRFIPFAMIGALAGYLSGFWISLEYEQMLLYIFVLIAVYLLIKMIRSLNIPEVESRETPGRQQVRKSYPVVVMSSFFTGLLSIGNTDWLIPHMEQKLNMATSRAVATGLFVMFVTSVFFLVMVFITVRLGLRNWPSGAGILFATCSGVILGSQIGTRLIRCKWFREHQKHAFILVLALSLVHLLW